MKAASANGAHLEPGELRWAMAVSAGIVFLTCLPYLFGWWLRPADFMGHVYNADDANVHLSWMRQAAEGRWFFTDRFTSEEQQPQFTHLLFLLLGKVAGLFGGSYRALVAVYHLTRVLAGWGLLVSVYLLAAYVYPQRSVRRLSLLVTGLSSGLGWFLALIGRRGLSVDYGGPLVMPEAITFFSLYTFPLFAVSLWLLVGAYTLTLRAFDTGRFAYAAAAGVLALVLGQIHAYDIPPFYAVIALYTAAIGLAGRTPPLREAALAAVVLVLSAPAPLYHYLVFRDNPVFRQKALTPTLSPPFFHYVLTYGLVLVAAAAGAWSLRRVASCRHGGFLILWAAATLAMGYLPVSFQRKMIEGVHIPLSLLAAWGWLALGRRWRMPGRVWAAILLGLTVPSNLALMGESARRLLTNNAEGAAHQLPPYYLDADERAALDWLRAHARPEDVVLSTPALGNYIPPYTGATAYASHWAETIHLGVKWRWVRGFLQDYTSDEWRQRFLREARIRYVYHGTLERLVGDFDPAGAPYLRAVFRQGGVAVYEVTGP